jgi:hypothetical protein
MAVGVERIELSTNGLRVLEAQPFRRGAGTVRRPGKSWQARWVEDGERRTHGGFAAKDDAVKGIEFVAVSIDEEKHAAEAFLGARPKWTLTVALDPQGKLPDLLQPPKMPTSYLIDGQGVLRFINAGFERADAKKIEARLLTSAPTLVSTAARPFIPAARIATAYSGLQRDAVASASQSQTGYRPRLLVGSPARSPSPRVSASITCGLSVDLPDDPLDDIGPMVRS